MKTADWRPWRGIVAALILSGCSDCDLPAALVCTAEEPCTCIQDFDCPGTDECVEGICVPYGTFDAGDVPDGGIDADIGFPDTPDADLGTPDGDDVPDGPDVPDIDSNVPSNECGGSAELVWMGERASVGDPCGDCSDGALGCVSQDALACLGEGVFNACGGCGELADRPGVPCGECGVVWCEGGEAVCVDDLGDECPDPLTRRFRLEPSAGDLGDGAENDRFGWTVLALPDGGLLVGAPEDDTSAVAAGRVFELTDGGSWTPVADVVAPDPREGDKFGESMAFDGGTLVVGAPSADRGEPGSGAVFIYQRTAGGWDLVTTIESPAALEDGGFGRSVGVSGDWIAIGEESRDGPDGQVHLYKRAFDGGLALHSSVTGVGGDDEGDRFGYSLVLDGDDLIVGATVEASFRGGAHAFRLQGDAWLPVELPLHPEVVSLSNFGYALALSEDRETLLVTAYLDDTDVPEGGAFFTYSRTDDGWAPGTRITAAVPAEPSRFGSSIAIQGDRIFVGAFREAASDSRSGSVHVFEEGATGWEEIAVLDPASVGSRLGYSVAVTPDGRVVSGAVQDRAAADDGGAVYVFEDIDETWVRDRILSPRSLIEGAFSRSLAIEGPTVVIGADESSRFAIRSGAAHVFSRTRDGWEHSTVLGPAEPEDLSRFGNAMAMNEEWLVIAARNATAPEARSGAVYVYARTDDQTFVEFARLTSPSPVTGGRFGASVALDGNRLLVGEDRERTDPDVAGTAWMFAFDGGNWVSEAELTEATMQAAGIVGNTVGLNGDTALVGSPGHDDGDGAAFRFDLSEGTWTFTQVIGAPESADSLGTAIEITETDLYIGATSGNGAESASGVVYVFERAASNVSGTLMSDLAGTSSRFGAALAVEDTLAIVGADRADVAGSLDGTVTVFSSESGSWQQVATIDAEDEGLGESFGFSVDIDLGRALVGALEDDVDGRNAGAAYVLE